MRPTDERGRPIGASPGGLPAGEATRAAGGLRGGRAAGFRGGRVRYRPTPCTRPLHKLAFCSLGFEKPSSKVSLVYCGLFETEIVLHWF